MMLTFKLAKSGCKLIQLLARYAIFITGHPEIEFMTLDSVSSRASICSDIKPPLLNSFNPIRLLPQL